MQRTGVAAHDELCIAQQRHQRTEWAAIQDYIRRFTGSAHRPCKLFFSRTVIYDASQPKFVAQPQAEFPETLRRPTFRPPPSAGTQHAVPMEVGISSPLFRLRRFFRSDEQFEERDAA